MQLHIVPVCRANVRIRHEIKFIFPVPSREPINSIMHSVAAAFSDFDGIAQSAVPPRSDAFRRRNGQTGNEKCERIDWYWFCVWLAAHCDYLTHESLRIIKLRRRQWCSGAHSKRQERNITRFPDIWYESDWKANIKLSMEFQIPFSTSIQRHPAFRSVFELFALSMF